jgi:hypothetical protein
MSFALSLREFRFPFGSLSRNDAICKVSRFLEQLLNGSPNKIAVRVRRSFGDQQRYQRSDALAGTPGVLGYAASDQIK